MRWIRCSLPLSRQGPRTRFRPESWPDSGPPWLLASTIPAGELGVQGSEETLGRPTMGLQQSFAPPWHWHWHWHWHKHLTPVFERKNERFCTTLKTRRVFLHEYDVVWFEMVRVRQFKCRNKMHKKIAEWQSAIARMHKCTKKCQMLP